MGKEVKEKRWSVIAEIEPLLEWLREQARAITDEDGDQFCANTAWYNKLKPQLVELVGFEASKKQLRSMDAYDLAYDVVYDELPSCRNCTCM